MMLSTCNIDHRFVPVEYTLHCIHSKFEIFETLYCVPAYRLHDVLQFMRSGGHIDHFCTKQSLESP